MYFLSLPYVSDKKEVVTCLINPLTIAALFITNPKQLFSWDIRMVENGVATIIIILKSKWYRFLRDPWIWLQEKWFKYKVPFWVTVSFSKAASISAFSTSCPNTKCCKKANIIKNQPNIIIVEAKDKMYSAVVCIHALMNFHSALIENTNMQGCAQTRPKDIFKPYNTLSLLSDWSFHAFT